jgi:hypothetical protein
MGLTDWLLVGVIAVGVLNFIALSAIAAFLWNIDSNAADATQMMKQLPSHGSIVHAADRIERAIQR